MSTARAQRASALALLLLMAIVAVYLLHAGRGTIAFFDEWDWISRRRGVSADTLLGPHNGHLSLVPVAVYKVLLQTAGLEHYWVFRVVLVAAHLTCVVLVFLLARQRVGHVGAAFAAGFVAVLGAAADDLLWAFQIGFVGGVALGLGALLALDRSTRRGDVVAALLLVLSLASASVGAAFIIAAAVEIAADPRRRARWWVIGAPLVLYAAWYLGYGESQMQRSNLGETPVFAAESGAAAAGGVLGLTLDYGRVLLLAVAAAVGYRAFTGARFHPRLLALVVAAPALWVLTGLSRAQFNEPAAPRYIYTGAILLVLLVCELARGRSVPRPAAVVALGVLLAFAAVANAHTVDGVGSLLRTRADDTRARLGALELVADRVDPGFQPSPAFMPQIQARTALSAEEAFGDLGLAVDELEDAPQAEGAAADDVLLLAQALTSAPTAADTTEDGPPPAAVGAAGATLDARRGCVRSTPTTPDARTTVDLPGGGTVRITAQSRAGVLTRRFAREFRTAPITEIAPGAAVLVRAAGDAAAGVPWRIQVASAGRVTVCRVG